MKVVIVEDETAAAVNLQSILKETSPETEVVAVLESVEESVDWFRHNPHPDLVFMDIHLADGKSFCIFDSIDIASPIIFTTAYDQYALEAFKVNSIDYILKPVNAAALHRSLEKLHRLTGAEKADYRTRVNNLAGSRNVPQQNVFLIHVRDKIIPLHRDDVAFFYTSNEKVTAYGFGGEEYQMDKTLETLQSLLPENDFFRANRQFIISRKAICEIAIWFGSRLSLKLSVASPERIIISKARAPEFKVWLKSVQPV